MEIGEKVSRVDESPWNYVPDFILLHIFQYLSPRELLMKAGMTCIAWNQVSYDELLWKSLFYKNFKINRSTPILPGKFSWYEEFKRLSYNTPTICTEILTEHGHEVLHVSFSHDGTMFATSSKDGYIIVWSSKYPSSVKYSIDMKAFSWKYTQFSQFNKSDTLLLVSGVHFGSPNSISGEIAVFSLQDGFNLQCRVGNKPYDIFGTWFGDRHLLSGDLHWLAHLVSSTDLWINKASQETSSEHTPILNQLFRFYNSNASSVRSVMVAECPEEKSVLSPLPPHLVNNHPVIEKIDFSKEGGDHIRYCSYYNHADLGTTLISNNMNNHMDDISPEGSDIGEDEDLAEQPEKLLIFTTGSKTYTPHQIGFKRVSGVKFPKVIDPGPSIKERIAERERRAGGAGKKNSPEPPDWLDFKSVQHRFDKIDHVIDLHGHIIGMGLSPDHRYLYVNSRPWPVGYVISNPLDPPPIAQEIDIHVIDLATFKEVGMMLRSHKAYTPNNECFFIFLDVSNEYIASGAEDKHGYLWDRHYGVCLAKLPHADVVNAVAFNPVDSGCLITTSDDYTIKVWRSKSFVEGLQQSQSLLSSSNFSFSFQQAVSLVNPIK